MYRIDEAQHKIITDLKYFHYDENSYNIGDIITKQHNLPDDIVEVYNRETGKDIQTIVYMLDHTTDEYMYENRYKYEYEVYSNSPLKCRMDLSAHECNNHLKEDPHAQNNRKLFIEAMAKAYVYKNIDSVEQALIAKHFSEKVEYIDNNIKVKRILRTS